MPQTFSYYNTLQYIHYTLVNPHTTGRPGLHPSVSLADDGGRGEDGGVGVQVECNNFELCRKLLR